jgi:predicted DNA-binding transcriptional regulator YafY
MNLERIHKIVQQIRFKGAVSMAKLVDVLQVSEPTIKRDLEFLRSRLGCPLEYDRGKRGYVIRDDSSDGGKPFELPGMWFSASEIHALLTMQHLLKDLQPRMLDSHIRPLQDRLTKLLGESHHPATEIMQRAK